MLSQKQTSLPPALLPPDIILEALGKPWVMADGLLLSPSLGALGVRVVEGLLQWDQCAAAFYRNTDSFGMLHYKV